MPRHRFHGDPERFNVVAEFVAHRFPEAQYVADVAGGQAMADYYDVVVGLHPDEALRAVVESADRSAVVVVPCCNFWSREAKLGRDELVDEIEAYHVARGGRSERLVLGFDGPKNHALVLLPGGGPTEWGRRAADRRR